MAKRKSVVCPECGRITHVKRKIDDASWRRHCSGCGYQFITKMASGVEVFVRPSTAKKNSKTRQYGPASRRVFALAEHHYLIRCHPLSRLGKALERFDHSGFKLLRDPKTGFPVARHHGDLKPGEVSLVLE